MRQISVVMAYYDNPTMLRRQYDKMKAYSADTRKHLEYVVVDDGSPNFPALAPEDRWFGFKLFRILVDVRWNQDAARNIGVHHASHDWVLLTDMDHLIPEETLRFLMQDKRLDPKTAYRFTRVEDVTGEPYKFHPNTWFLATQHYHYIGGYDERFAGYYGTDWDFRDRATARSKEVKQLPLPVIRVGREHTPDASTPREFGRKTPQDSRRIQEIRRQRESQGKWQPLRMTFPYQQVAVWPF